MSGWIPCAICTDTITLDEHRSARCWTDPTGITVAAHRNCLIRVGEHELSLPPDPGEPTATSDPGERHEHPPRHGVVESH